MTEPLLTWISPVSPAARTSPVSRSTIRSSTPSGGNPAESSRHRSGRSTGLAAITGTSLAPYAGSQRTPVRRVTISATLSVTGVAPHMM